MAGYLNSKLERLLPGLGVSILPKQPLATARSIVFPLDPQVMSLAIKDPKLRLQIYPFMDEKIQYE